jgi:hypothetical protein
VCACSIYKWGSRLWGTAKERVSDLDLCIVTNSRPASATVKRGGVEACVMSLEDFRRQADEHRFRVLCCVCGPDEGVLRSGDRLRGRFKVVPARLASAVAAEVERDWERIEKWYAAVCCAVWRTARITACLAPAPPCACCRAD